LNAVKVTPEKAAANWKLVKVLFDAKDITAGFTELRKAVDLGPGNFEALGMPGEI
jgi:hypothetical protein